MSFVKPIPSFIALCAIAVVAMVLSACGAGSGEVVARIDGVGAISKGTLEHWMPIEAVLFYELTPRKRPPKWVVPDPPDYKACIAHLKVVHLQETPPLLIGKKPQPTPAQVKRECQDKQRELRADALNFLIDSQWKIGEGEELGLTLTDAEVKQRLQYIKRITYPKEAQFKKYLATTGQTVSDMLFRAKVQLVEVKLQQWLVSLGKSGQGQRTAAKWAVEFPRKWVKRTTCQAGYVAPDCREYKGPLPPGTEI
jgi:foldase protein PrsA